MCRKQIMPPLPLKLAKITLVVIFFCFAECAAGSCLSYGHACWGGHGKRNNNPQTPILNKESKWFLSKLMQTPLDVRYDLDAPTSQQLFSDAQMEADPLKGQDDFRSLQDVYANDESTLFEEVYPNFHPHLRKFKTQKFLDKRSAKMI